MYMNVEGIIIQKTAYKERDLICHILLRSGETLTVYFYGGRGGGKKNKGSIIEVGFMLKMQLQVQNKKLETRIYIAKEYSLLWSSDQIRNTYPALCLQSFYLELISKITVSSNLDENIVSEHEGIFKVVSNALFYLDDALAKKDFHLHTHLFLFLTKLIYQLGITADIDHCLYCDTNLTNEQLCLFLVHEGGFTCHDCHTQKDEFLSENKLLFAEMKSSGELRSLLKKIPQTQYKDYSVLKDISYQLSTMQFHFLNYQFEFKADQFKTWKLL